jgi:DNA repair protein RadC
MSELAKITSSKSAETILRAVYDPDTLGLKETFICIYLNRNSRVLAVVKLSEGATTGTCVDIKHVFKTALDLNASAIIISHNHPSGNLEASQADRQMTHKIKEAGLLFDINLLDHVILTDEGYYSFADNSIL